MRHALKQYCTVETAKQVVEYRSKVEARMPTQNVGIRRLNICALFEIDLLISGEHDKFTTNMRDISFMFFTLL